MRRRTPWVARGWLAYLLAGVGWVTFGSVVLGDPQGLGLIFIGLACLAFGVYGATHRVGKDDGFRPGSRS
jgi:hypothetical protein